MDFSQIQELIRMLSKHKISEFILTEGDFKLVIRNQSAPEGMAAPMAQAPVVIPTSQPVVAVTPQVQTSTVPAMAAPAKADMPAASSEKPAAAPPAAAGGSDDSSRYVPIKSPMVGTFYRSSSPDKPAFVKIGDTVDAGTPVCIIEAMKLFNEIESEVKGRIVKVLVEDASPVEYEQPLFLVDPT
jgi:acetyl-CoA carboxylase biotin carboxyl carrier protein